MHSICGADCLNCQLNKYCKGCEETNGHPFGGDCVLAKCCFNSENKQEAIKEYKIKLIAEINALHILNMPFVEDLNALAGIFVNIDYAQEDGTSKRYLNDNDIYLGNQYENIEDFKKFFGVVANDEFILISEYEANGKNAKVLVYKNR